MLELIISWKYIKKLLNLSALVREGDQSQNIKIYDGDSRVIEKSENILKNQVLNQSAFQVNKTNINPAKMIIDLTGNIKTRGPQTLKHVSSLLQALAIPGGRRNLSGRIKHLRINDDGSTYWNSFIYDQKAIINSLMNPVLIEGDIIGIIRNTLSNIKKAFEEIRTSVIRSYGLYKIFTD